MRGSHFSLSNSVIEKLFFARDLLLTRDAKTRLPYKAVVKNRDNSGKGFKQLPGDSSLNSVGLASR